MSRGSRTQPVRLFPNGSGANVVPFAGQGFVRVAPITNLEFQPAVLMQVPVGGIGQYWPRPNVIRRPVFTGTFTITGRTLDASLATLGSCTVDLFKVDAFDTWVATTTSDGSGNFSFSVSQNSTYYWMRAYKTGSPDTSGVTINTVVAV